MPLSLSLSLSLSLPLSLSHTHRPVRSSIPVGRALDTVGVLVDLNRAARCRERDARQHLRHHLHELALIALFRARLDVAV